MTIEKYSCYKFEVFHSSGVLPIHGATEYWEGYVFKIHNEDIYGGDIESDEWFESEQEARFAAIGHISKLEDGPDEPDYDAQPPSIDWDERRKIGE